MLTLGIILGVLVILAIVLVFMLASTRYIGPTDVGLVIKRVGKKLPADEPIAFNGEAGYQWQLLMPGLRMKLWPIYSITKYPWVQIPAGEIGVVVAQVGTPLPIGAKSAVYKPEFGAFQGSGQVRVAVCGAHLSGLPLNGQLTTRGGRLVTAVQSAPEYKFYALPGGPPYRPGMVRVAEDGGSIEMEIWELPAREFGSFVAGIPAPLGIGMVKLTDGGWVQGFVCEAAATKGAEDITALGGWRAYLDRV